MLMILNINILILNIKKLTLFALMIAKIMFGINIWFQIMKMEIMHIFVQNRKIALHKMMKIIKLM